MWYRGQTAIGARPGTAEFKFQISDGFGGDLRHFVGSSAKLIGFLLITITLSPFFAFAASQQVDEADQSLVAALGKSDQKTLDRLLHNDFVWIDRTGVSHTKAEVVQSPGSFTAGTTNLKAHDYATVVYLTGTKEADSQKVRFVRVWVNDKAGWRAILQQDTTIFGKTATAQATVAVGTKCDNPCKTVPYDAPSPDAQAVVESWEGLEDAVNHRDADGWASHVADEFVFNVKEDGNPLTKADRVAIIRKQAQGTTVTDIGTVIPGSMAVNVFGDVAVMTDRQQPTVGGNPYKAMRIWIKRDKRWQLIYSQQTTEESKS